MTEEIQLKNNHFVDVEDEGECYTVVRVIPKVPCSIFKDHIESYVLEARKIIDEWSMKYHTLGIDELLGAIIHEFIGHRYVGKHNE